MRILSLSIAMLACVPIDDTYSDTRFNSTDDDSDTGVADIDIGTSVDIATETGCGCTWTGIACWAASDGPVCVGTIDETELLIVAPSVFDQRLAAGVYTPVDAPQCAIDPLWESVTCYVSFVAPDVTVCVGLLDGVLVPSADPCGVQPFGTKDVHGLYATPVDAAVFADLNPTNWPDPLQCG